MVLSLDAENDRLRPSSIPSNMVFGSRSEKLTAVVADQLASILLIGHGRDATGSRNDDHVPTS